MLRSLRILAVVAVLFPSLISIAHAEAAPGLFITELQTGSANSGSEEFVELYNNTDQAINLDALWQIQYFSSTKIMQTGFDWNSTAPTGEIDLTGTVPAHEYFLLGTYSPDSVAPDQIYDNPHFSNTAGGVQLAMVNDSDTTPVDRVGWSSNDSPPNGLKASPPAGGSLQRQVDETGNYLDPNGNLGPFVPATAASPKEAWQTPPPEDKDTDPEQTGTDQPPVTEQPETISITELLPNPASPATDTNDEYVEIYNYGDELVDLRGFTIQTGLTYAYSYSIPDNTLAPGGYATFTSGDTPLSLANSGGRARLLNPSGQLIYETQPYGVAVEGQAWAVFGDEWQWTTTSTPGAANILTAAAVTAAKKTAAPAKKTTTSKAKKTSASSASSKKAGSVAGAQANNGDPNSDDQPPALHPLVLAGVGGGALLYGAYEYRTDVANSLYRLRKYRETRRAARAALKGA